MPRKKIFLDKDKNEKIEIAWRGGFREISIAYNDQPITTMNRTQAYDGQSIELPNGDNLNVKVDPGFFSNLNLKLNNKSIPGAPGDPIFHLRQVFYILAIIGTLNILLGFLLSNIDLKIKGLENFGYINVSLGIVYIALGYAISKGNYTSLIIAIILLFFDLILSASFSEITIMTAIVTFKVILIIFIIKGFKYMKSLRINNKKQNEK